MKCIGIEEVIKMTGLSRTTIWRLENDETFPLSEKTNGKLKWLDYDIQRWIVKKAKRGTQVNEKKILRLKEVIKKVQLSRTTIYRLECNKAFPASFNLSKGILGWFESDIDQWILKHKGEKKKNLKPNETKVSVNCDLKLYKAGKKRGD